MHAWLAVVGDGHILVPHEGRRGPCPDVRLPLFHMGPCVVGLPPGLDNFPFSEIEAIHGQGRGDEDAACLIGRVAVDDPLTGEVYGIEHLTCLHIKGADHSALAGEPEAPLPIGLQGFNRVAFGYGTCQVPCVLVFVGERPFPLIFGVGHHPDGTIFGSDDDTVFLINEEIATGWTKAGTTNGLPRKG